jgi:phage gp36-like protein
MAYTDKAYFLTKIKDTELDKLILDGSDVPQDDYLVEAIKSADSVIDGYLRNAVDTVPLVTVPDMIKQYSYFIALYFLHDRIQYNEIPQRVKDNYDLSINYLKDVASGKASIEGIEEDEQDEFIDYDVNTNIFTRSSF